MNELLGDWERFLHEREIMPDLVQCAVMHEQFEAVHPFLDGNGRVGRLLIVLFLMERERLSAPLLYLSAYIEAPRRLLQAAAASANAWRLGELDPILPRWCNRDGASSRPAGEPAHGPA